MIGPQGTKSSDFYPSFYLQTYMCCFQSNGFFLAEWRFSTFLCKTHLSVHNDYTLAAASFFWSWSRHLRQKTFVAETQKCLLMIQ